MGIAQLRALLSDLPRRAVFLLGCATAVAAGAAIALEGSILRKAAVFVLLFALIWVVAGSVRNPLAPVVGYIYLIPFLNVAREAGAITAGPLTLTPAMMFLGLVVAVTYISLSRHRTPSGGALVGKSKVLLGVVVTGGLIATVAGPLSNDTDLGLALSLFLDGVVLPALLFFVVLRAEPSIADTRRVAGAVVISACIAVALGLVLRAAGIGPIGVIQPGADPVVVAGLLRQQATFTFGNPNDFGLVAALVLPVALTLAVTAGGIGRALWLFAFVIILVAAIYTFSRGTMAGIALGFLAMSLMNKGMRRLAIGLAALTTLVLALLPSVVPVILARFTQAGMLESEPVVDRARAAVLSLRIIVTQPFGVGPGGFSQQWVKAGLGVPILQSPHDLLLGVAVEYGIAAGLAFAIWVAIVIWTGSRHLRQGNVLLVGLVAGAFSFVFTGTATGWELSHRAGLVPLGTPTHLFFVVIALLVLLAREIPAAEAITLGDSKHASPLPNF